MAISELGDFTRATQDAEANDTANGHSKHKSAE
jgi:hypothetical protein